MPRLSYRAAALRDTAEIASYIEQETGSRAVADAFIDKLSHLHIGNIIRGRRDLGAYFAEQSDDES